MALTTGKLIGSWLFLVCCAAFDTTITVIGVLNGWGKEGNPLINWIQDESLMLLCMVAITITIFMLFSFYLLPRMKQLMKYPTHAMAVYFLFIIGGAWRLTGGLSWLLPV